MRALIYRYGSICEPDIMEGFRELSIELFEIDIEIRNKDVLPSKVVEVVGNFLQNKPVDFVFSVNYYPVLSEICNLFHIRYFSWTVDSPVPEIYSKTIGNEWNRTFLFDRKQHEDVIAYNPERIFHLPLGANPKKMKERIEAMGALNKAEYAHPIAFVGSLYSEKNPLSKVYGLSPYTEGFLEGVINAQKLVYGSFFAEEIIPPEVVDEIVQKAPAFEDIMGKETYLTARKLVAQYYLANAVTVKERAELFTLLSDLFDTHIYTASDTSKYPKLHNHGTCSTHGEMPVIFAESGVNLNPTAKGIQSGIPLRVFDVLSCEGFLITNYQAELTDCFDVGNDLIAYTSLEECAELCAYFGDRPKERAEIARAGFETLCQKHTYELRLATMLTKGFAI